MGRYGKASRREAGEELYLGMVYLSPDSKSPATDNNKSIANRIADARTRVFRTDEKKAFETADLRISESPNLSSVKTKKQLLPSKKGIHGGVERGRSRAHVGEGDSKEEKR